MCFILDTGGASGCGAPFFFWLLPQLLLTLVIALNESPLNNILLFSLWVHHYFRKSTTPLIFTSTYSWFSLLIVKACFVHSNLKTMCENLIVWLQPACSFTLVCRYWKHQLLFFRLSEELATQSLTWCLLHSLSLNKLGPKWAGNEGFMPFFNGLA